MGLFSIDDKKSKDKGKAVKKGVSLVEQIEIQYT